MGNGLDAMGQLAFHYHSQRAAKARLAHRLEGLWLHLLTGLMVVLLLAGIALLVYSQPIGWLVFGLAALPAMLVGWYEGELRDLGPLPSPRTIDDILAVDVLGRLPAKPTPRDIATIVGSTQDGFFYAVRFGVSARFLENITTEDEQATAQLWQEAWRLREQTGQPTITSGLLLVALVRSAPDYDMLLARLNLHDADLIQGVYWRQHIFALVDHHARPKRTGGIARDWSFGYIPTLDRFGQNVSENISRGGLLAVKLQSHAEVLDQLVITFSTSGRQNAALVGMQGAGKTSIVHAFAERLLDATAPLPETLKFRQVFVLDAGSLLAAAPGRGELERLVMEVLGEAYAAKNIIVCLENAELFFEDGIGSVDLTNVLLPILEAGRLRMILTMDEQKYLKIGSRNPALLNALNRISVSPAGENDTLAIMQDQLIRLEFSYNVTYTYQSLLEAYRLSERYVYDLAQPGRSMKLLESAAHYAENGLVTINSVQQAIEKTLGVKVGVASGEAERETLLNLEDLIHKRMINQTRAVQVVSDALRRARAGVRNENRPIGTFLFLGPTGVGKTELSKALGDVYFGGEDRLIRLDLNEFVRPEDVSRLIADGAEDPTSLTSQAMKQPFSVVLLDEIEKAHPAVLTTLLQLLDEGILRDIKNREVSFRDAIIIATSNAGADRIREYIERGYQLDQFEQQFVDELISSNQFRPEFLNRFDEIVLFKPLDKPELLQVVDLILAGINRTLALQKITVMVEDEAKAVLVEKGYDLRLGARPLRRVVQRAVENTIAKQMLSGRVTPGSNVTISRDQVEQALGSEQPTSAILESLPPADAVKT